MEDTMWTIILQVTVLHRASKCNTIPYTPQQNGVVERKKHTLKEMANYMFQSKGLSLKYWEEDINYENYIVNCTPTKDF